MVLHAQGPCDWRRVRRVVFSFFRPLGRIVGTPPPRTVPAVVAAALSKLCLYFAHLLSSVWNPLSRRVPSAALEPRVSAVLAFDGLT